jgi:hypothetical protein
MDTARLNFVKVLGSLVCRNPPQSKTLWRKQIAQQSNKTTTTTRIARMNDMQPYLKITINIFIIYKCDYRVLLGQLIVQQPSDKPKSQNAAVISRNWATTSDRGSPVVSLCRCARSSVPSCTPLPRSPVRSPCCRSRCFARDRIPLGVLKIDKIRSRSYL